MVEEKDNSEIPGMKIEKYSTKKPIMPENTSEMQKEMDKTRKELEKFKAFVLKKYPFTMALSILPPQAIPKFVEEEEVPKETEKLIQLYMVIPEEHFKEIPKIKPILIKELERLKQKVWLQIKSPVDVWEICFDSKFDLFSAIALSFPLYDTGLLEGIRVAEIHKSLVLQKFEKYVVSYVLAGSLVRGDTTKFSDVDVFIIINDTDVKRMPRLELKERLRNIIFQYISEATALAGAKKNILNVQPYLLTDFWESVKDAHPVMFTFIRDGVPIHDRGTFMPWKALLRMGKLKPSPEAIDMFMSSGDQTVARAKRMLLDIVIHDIYWGVTQPTQALFMLHGLPTPEPKYLAQEVRNVFVKKEKMLEEKYAKIIEGVVKFYKDYEHEKVKDATGAQVDKFLKDTEDYLKRLKELRKQIDKKAQEKTAEQIYNDVFNLLKTIFGNKSQAALISEFEEKLVKKGKLTPQHLKILNEIVAAKVEVKKGKSNLHKIDKARRDSASLVNDLLEYSQRCEISSMDKGRMRVKYKKKGENKVAEILHCNGTTFLFEGEVVKKLGEKITETNMEEVTNCIEQQKGKKTVDIKPKVFELLKKELGEFELII